MKKSITIIAVILSIYKFKAQNHDLGILIGTVNLQSDYGRSSDRLSFFTNNGISLSFAHYLNFYDLNSNWRYRSKLLDHLKVKTEIKYLNNGVFKHTGRYSKKNSSDGEKLRAMKGSLRMLDLGVNLEYYLFPVDKNRNNNYTIYLNPYLSFGLNYSFYKNGITSELGNWTQDRSLLADWYSDEIGLDVGAGQAFSLCSGIGITSKLNSKIDLVTQVYFQYFFSDSIDGLVHKTNDYSGNIQLGIIYHLNTH